MSSVDAYSASSWVPVFASITGLYWAVPALLTAMVAAIIGAWVVLVEAAR